MALYGIDISECVEAKGKPSAQGYGRVCVNYKTYLAHRYAYEQAFGKIPRNLHIHHRCRNKLCINVEHLEALTNSEHKKKHLLEDGLAGKALEYSQSTTCIRGHELTQGLRQRICTTCNRARGREWARKNRQKLLIGGAI